MAASNLWIMIPARGGSRGVPRKNVRKLAGVPLIVHVIRTALQACDPGRIIVITDDDEIAEISATEKVRVVREPKTTGKATLDGVALKVADEIEQLGAGPGDIFLTLQPTCPFLRPERIEEALTMFANGAGSVITVVDDRHLNWRLDENGDPVPAYKARVNRQQIEPFFRESGAIIGCRLGDLRKHGTRIVQPIRLIEVSKDEAIDIDSFTDWAVAEYLCSRRKILLRADASKSLGMGHTYRTLAIAQEIARHKILIATDSAKPLGQEFFSRFPFDVVSVDGDSGFVELVREHTPDMVVLDQLDTSADYVRAIKQHATKVITFEDLGPGAIEADLLVSDLYKNLDLPDDRQLTGISNAILAPNFESVTQIAPFRDKVEHILVVFGGTDPSGLTKKTLSALSLSGYSGTVSVVLGPGADHNVSLSDYSLSGEIFSNVTHMPGVMLKADLALCSAGRTITELVSLGVPVLCLCQNEKELTHTHASARFGVVNLGLGAMVEPATLAAHIAHVRNSITLRATLRKRALRETETRSNAAVIQRIMQKIGWN